MLTFAEELVLLGLDDEGEFLPVSEPTMECALVGAVLMDLVFSRGMVRANGYSSSLQSRIYPTTKRTSG